MAEPISVESMFPIAGSLTPWRGISGELARNPRTSCPAYMKRRRATTASQSISSLAGLCTARARRAPALPAPIEHR
jgi:hypothetical protein